MTCIPRLLALTACLAAVAADLQCQAGSAQMGHARARRMAELGRLPAAGEVVVDHIVNYHRHALPMPRAGEDIAVDLRWDVPLRAHGAGESVLQIGLTTSQLHDLEHARPLNVALVIDCSGSMADRDKMSRVQRALQRFIGRLRPTDRIAVVGYSSEARVILPSTEVGAAGDLRAIVAGLNPGGSTNLHAGLMCGYAEVAKHARAGGGARTDRVILLTDGIANAGVVDAREIAADSRRCNAEGIDLSTIGVGVDFNRELLGALARSGRGLFHFVADESDIERVFDAEVQSLMGVVARRVKLELRHAPGVELVRVYGYEPQRLADGFSLALDDFNHGLTNVVIAKFRRHPRDDGRDDDAAPEIRVELAYDRPDGDAREPARRRITRRTRFLDPATLPAGAAADHEVAKNYTIAVMARAMRRMAEAAEVKRLGDAERHVRIALDFARMQYPSTEDPDLLRVRAMLEKYKDVLGRHIERFRDL